MGRDEVDLFPAKQEQKEKLSYGDICRKYCADYLAMGMSLSEYWDGDPSLTRYYREAHRLRQKRDNFNAWLQGVYIYNALVCVSPLYRDWVKDHNPEPYFSEPLDIFPKTVAEEKSQEKRQYENNKAKILSWKERVNRLFAKKEET